VASIRNGKASCRRAKTHKDCCKQQKQNADNDCAKGNCNAMLSCSTCGFIAPHPVSLLPAVIELPQHLSNPFLIGALSDYHGNGWNPPKA
jgi:hypothetical protein